MRILIFFLEDFFLKSKSYQQRQRKMKVFFSLFSDIILFSPTVLNSNELLDHEQDCLTPVSLVACTQ
ncbi:unnamed protein product [Rotaria socialis]